MELGGGVGHVQRRRVGARNHRYKKPGSLSAHRRGPERRSGAGVTDSSSADAHRPTVGIARNYLYRLRFGGHGVHRQAQRLLDRVPAGSIGESPARSRIGPIMGCGPGVSGESAVDVGKNSQGRTRKHTVISIGYSGNMKYWVSLLMKA